MGKKINSRQNKKSRQFWLWGCMLVLAILIIVQFVYISKQDSNSLKLEIRRVETKLKNEQNQLKNQIQSLESNLNSIKSTFDYIKNDSTLLIKISEIDKRINELEIKVKSLPTESDNANYTNWKLWLAFGLAWLVLIVLLFFFRKKKSQPTEFDREKIIKTVLESHMTSDKLYSKEFYKFPQSIKKIEDEIASLTVQIIELQNKGNGTVEKNDTKENVSSSQPKTDDVKFFKSITGKILTEELQSSTDASFKLHNIKDSEAEFTYCGGVVNQDFFTDVCSFANNPSDVPNKTKITTTTSGVVKKDSNNNWEVTEKAKIKFE